MSLVAYPNPVTPGQVVAVTLIAVNRGPDVPQNMAATLTLPQGLKLQSCETAYGVVCTGGDGTLAATFPPSAAQPFAGSIVTMAFKVNDNLIKPCPPNKQPALCTYSASLTVSGVVTSELQDTYSNNAASTTINVVLPGAAAQMTVSPTQLNFGNALFQYGSAAQYVTLVNAGAGAVSVLPAVEGHFAVVYNSCEPFQYPQPGQTTAMAPGDSCTFGVGFTAQRLGQETGKLVFEEYSIGQPVGQQIVTLKGTGVGVLGGKTSQPFPMLLIGNSYEEGVWLFNVGPVPVPVLSVTLSGTDFSMQQAGDCTVVAPASGCFVASVTFAPTEPVQRKGKVMVNFDGPSSPLIVELSGAGTALSISTPEFPVLSPGQYLDMGVGRLGVRTAPVPVTIQNVYTQPLRLGAEVTKPFQQDTDCPKELPGLSSCTVNLFLKAHADGIFGGTLTITAKDPASPQNFSLGGTGVGIKRGKIYVHYDYMVAPDHTHDPEVVAPGGLQKVIDSFAFHGVELVIDPNHTAIPEVQFIDYATYPCGPPDTNVTFDSLRAMYFQPKRASEHYAVFGHYSDIYCSNGGESGVADLPGTGFIVSLGIEQQERFTPGLLTPILAQTFMHELGHNLGLHHGGNGDDTNYKPHFLSIMNYAYQFAGIVLADAPGLTHFLACHADPDCPPGSACLGDPRSQYCRGIDYSTQLLPTTGPEPGVLDENDLDETAGLGSGNADVIFFTDAQCDIGGGFGIGPSEGPVDWDGDGVATNMHVQADVIARWWESQGYLCPTGFYERVGGGDDWAFLQPPAQAEAEAKEAAVNGNSARTPDKIEEDDLPVAESSRRTSPSSGPELTFAEARERHILHAPKQVSISVSPSCGLAQKPVAPGSPTLLAVAILGQSDFDVNEIDPMSLRLHKAAAVSTQVVDVNGDGIPDLMATFDMAVMRLHPQAKKVRLSGWLKDSRVIFGEDRIAVVQNMNGVPPTCR